MYFTVKHSSAPDVLVGIVSSKINKIKQNKPGMFSTHFMKTNYDETKMVFFKQKRRLHWFGFISLMMIKWIDW